MKLYPIILGLRRLWPLVSRRAPNAPKFSNLWSSGHFERWQNILIEQGFAGRSGLHYLEIGCYEGNSLFWMLDHILTAPSARAVVIDPLGPTYGLSFMNNIANSKHREKVKVKVGYSRLELRDLPLKSFDIVYIDGSHSMADVTLDIALSWDLVKIGGVIILDDYLMGEGELPEEYRPRSSIDHFIVGFRRWIEVLSKDYQVVIKKTGELEDSSKIKLNLDSAQFDWYHGVLTIGGKRFILSDEDEVTVKDFLKASQQRAEITSEKFKCARERLANLIEDLETR